MFGFIEPVGTSCQSASAERSELMTSSIRMKTRISSMTFFLFIYANSLYGEERRPFQTSGSHGGFRHIDSTSPMSHRTSVHDLKGLILSFHSLVAIETLEEERVRALLNEIAADLRLPFYEWSVTSGFARVNGHRIEGTEDPLAVLKHIAQIENTEAIYLLKDIGPHLSNANISRLLRELAQKLISTRSALVLTGEPLQLPQDIERLAVLFDLELPDDDEMRMVVRSVLDSFGRRQQVRVDLSR